MPAHRFVDACKIAGAQYPDALSVSFALLVSPEPPVTLPFASLLPSVTVSWMDQVNGRSGMGGLYIKRKRRQSDGSARGRVAPPEKRDAASRSSQAPLELVAGREPDHRCATSGQGAVGGAGQHIAHGELAVRCERRADALILWLRGALDHATATLFDRELDAQLLDQMPVVVDVTELEFMDLAGLNALMRFHQLARERGDRLSFRHRTQIAHRPLVLTRIVQLRSRWATRGTVVHEGSRFALAMACADVDHPRPGDRPGAA